MESAGSGASNSSPMYGAVGSDANQELLSLLKTETAPFVGDYTACSRYAEAWEQHPRHFVNEARFECVDLLFRVCESYKVSGETLCAAVIVMDRFYKAATNLPATLRPGQSSQIELDIAALAMNPALVAVTCFLDCCKFRELVCPVLQDLEMLTVQRCTEELIRNAEYVLMTAIDWELLSVTGMDVAHKLLGSFAPESLAQLITQHVEFHVEMSYYCSEMLLFTNCEIAVAALYCAAQRLKLSESALCFIPLWMMTARAEKAKTMLAACFRTLKPDKPASSLAPLVIPQESKWEGDVTSPTNVDGLEWGSKGV